MIKTTALPGITPACAQSSACERKAVALLSGGLDSALAIHLVKSQGIDVTAVHFTSFFSSVDPTSYDSPVNACARQLEVPVIFRPKGPDFLELIRNPKYGHGKNLNPCIDCRIYTFIKAKALMEEIGASFLVTGEVVGQRPMSQRRDAIRLIEKAAGCDGLVLRPLSAKLLPPTRCEPAGVVDRERLLDVAGRGRKVQLRLAAELGLTGYSTPAGGCLLTDKNFSARLRDLLNDSAEVSQEELELLQLGRHIRIRPGLKMIVGRDEAENMRLETMSRGGIRFAPVDFAGPLVVVLGQPDPVEEDLIGSVLLRYTKKSARGEWVGVTVRESPERRLRVREAAGDRWIADHLVTWRPDG